MKKFLAVLLSAVILFSFAGCGRENNSSDTNTVDLEYYAKLGQIPECKYKLGDSVETLKNELEAAEQSAHSDDDEYVYEVTEGEKSVRIDNGSFMYYYEKEKESGGISFIVSLDTSYGFESGTTVLEIKNALPELEPEEKAATADDVFFLYGFSEGTILKYTFNNYVIVFVFDDNMLCASAIYDTDNWTL